MKRTYLIALLACTALIPTLVSGQVQPDRPKPSPKASKKLVSSIELYTKNQDSTGAIKGIKEVLVKDPKNFHANAWLGYIHMLDGQYEAAVDPLTVAHDVDPADINVLNNLAVCLERAGQRDGAYAAYKQLNTARPGDGVVLNKLGVMALDRGETQNAVSYLEEADKAAPGDKMTTMNLAVAYLRAQQNDKAKVAYERLVAMNPDNETMLTALSWLGFTAIQAGDYRGAIGHLEKAETLNPNDLEVLNNLANAYSNVEPPDETKAAAVYRKMVTLDPSLYEPWYNLGVLYLRANNAGDAVDANEKALARKPNEPFALNNLGRGYEMQGRFAMAGDMYAKASNQVPTSKVFAHNAAVAYVKAKDEAKSRIYIERARKLGDDDLDLTMVLGDSYAKEGRTQEAIDMLTKAADRVTNRSDLWFNLGVMHEKLGHDKEAEASYLKSLELKPDDIDANTNLALLMLKRGDWQAATPYMEKVSGLNPASVDAKLNLAAAYYKAGRVEDAVALWKRALELAPGRTDVRLNLANTLWADGDYAAAHGHFERALKEQPKSAQALNGMGLWYLREGKTADAVTNFRAAVKSEPKYMPPYNNLAVSLERQNKRKEAIAVLEQALKVDPNFADAKKNLQRLKASEK